MSTKIQSGKVQSRRWSQILAWAVVSLFVLGFLFPLLGVWTGAVLGVWFVGTRKPRRGFLWLMVLNFVPTLVANWREFPSLTGPEHALEYVAWMLLVALLTVLPFLFHRLVSPRLLGFLSTLPLPLAGRHSKRWLGRGSRPISSASTSSRKAKKPIRRCCTSPQPLGSAPLHFSFTGSRRWSSGCGTTNFAPLKSG